MSLATRFFNEVVRGQEVTDPETRYKSIYSLKHWGIGYDTPLNVMGWTIKCEEKCSFVVELQELVREAYNTGVNSIEDLFWLIHTADMLNVRFDIVKRHQELANFFYRQFVKGNYQDIEEIIRTIRRI